MNRVERIFALQEIEPFSRLSRRELATIANVCRPRTFSAGEILLRGDEPARRLSIVVSGSLEGNAEKVHGFLGLLLGVATPQPLKVGEEGASCLQITRGHFFTIIYECPELLAWMLERKQEVTT